MAYETDFHEQEGEDSYFVSMTDIMVGMLFVFIILLMFFVFRIQNTSEPTVPLSEHVATIKQRDDGLVTIRKLEDEITRLNANPLEKYLKAADAARETILKTLQDSIERTGGFRSGDIKAVPEQGILRLSGDMLFPNGISKISTNSPGERAIRALAAGLVKVLPCFSIGPASSPIRSCNPNAAFIDAVFVEGHTDNSPLHGIVESYITDNLSLSARRAINTVQLIYFNQPSLDRMYSISPSQVNLKLGEGASPLINPAAYGDTRPAFSNDTEDGKRAIGGSISAF